jgi:hypothetical protein
MPFAWAYLDGEGREGGRSEPFEDRDGAEQWMGTAWEDLLARGYREVELIELDAGRTLYRMGLESE